MSDERAFFIARGKRLHRIAHRQPAFDLGLRRLSRTVIVTACGRSGVENEQIVLVDLDLLKPVVRADDHTLCRQCERGRS